MRVNLSDKVFFEAKEVLFDKKVNFIFGKNGCGKSTIATLIQEQFSNEYDVRIFNGFDGIVGENSRLETVILGEENNDINNHILELEREIEEINEDIKIIINNISESGDYPNNLWKKIQERQKEKEEQQKIIDKFCRESASEIKIDQRNISSRSYDINDFKKDISNASLLSDNTVKEFEELIKSDIKNAIRLPKLDDNLEKELKEVNEVLQDKVKEQKLIPRFENNERKKNFARSGLELHQVGEHCAFCGGEVSEETIDELTGYFSADDIKKLQEKIETKIKSIELIKAPYGNIITDVNSFYPEYKNNIKDISDNIEYIKSEILSFLDILKNALENKKSNLFSEMEKINIDIPNSIFENIERYNDIVFKNNDSDLPKKQEKAKEKLRYHEVKIRLDKFKYDVKLNELRNREKDLEEVEKEVKEEENKIEKLNSNINRKQTKIFELQAKTRNEKILVDKVNKKLLMNASFELIHQETTNEYLIKCKLANEVRKVTELSTGEKNILAFLYFLEKLKEDNNKKCIIFDDPMNSNDDTFQYLIIEGLRKMGKDINDNNKLIMLTHNVHFYLNVKYEFNNYNKYNFIILNKLNKKIEVKKLNNLEEDFKTSYQALWYELIVLFENRDVISSMLINPIRRILETYIKFNCINNFYKDLLDAKKLFDVNSHSIDDLEADLNGKTKEDILKIMKKCFENNNALSHFNQYWEDK